MNIKDIASAVLTPRQEEIALLISRGEYPKHIARVLGVQLHAIQRHCLNMQRAFGVCCAMELTVACVEYRHLKGLLLETNTI